MKQAIEGKRENAFARDPATLTIVGYDTNEGLEVAGYDERVLTIDKTITEEWIQSIMRLGVLEPVLVRKNGPRVDIVDGRRRVLGAREANKRILANGGTPLLVTCVVFKGTDKIAYEAMVASNEGRVDDSPIVRAQKMARMMRLHRATEHDLALTFQMRATQVREHLKLLDLADSVQTLVGQGQLQVGAALSLVDLPRSEQEAKAVEYALSGTTVTEAKRQKQVRRKPPRERSTEDEETRGKRPSIVVVRKLEANDAFIANLSEDARHLLHWFGGNEQSAWKIKGLTAALRDEA